MSDIHIRRWHPQDVNTLAQLANNKNIARNLTARFPYPYRISDAEDFVKGVSVQQPVTHMAITRDNEVVGAIGADITEKVGVVGYWIAEPYWSRGIVTAALTLFISYCAQQLQLELLQAKTIEDNIASRKVLEKAGFSCKGKQAKELINQFGIFDTLLFEKLLSTW